MLGGCWLELWRGDGVKENVMDKLWREISAVSDYRIRGYATTFRPVEVRVEADDSQTVLLRDGILVRVVEIKGKTHVQSFPLKVIR